MVGITNEDDGNDPFFTGLNSVMKVPSLENDPEHCIDMFKIKKRSPNVRNRIIVCRILGLVSIKSLVNTLLLSVSGKSPDIWPMYSENRNGNQ